MKKLTLYIVLLCSVVVPTAVSAHLEGGLDIAQATHTVDFGHTPEVPKTGEITVMAINVLNNETGAVVDPEKIWLRISGPSGVVFAGYLGTELEHINVSYVFPEAGDYEITARFPTIESIEDVTIPLRVDKGNVEQEVVVEPIPTWYMWGRSAVTGILVIVVCILIVKYYTTKQDRLEDEK